MSCKSDDVIFTKLDSLLWQITKFYQNTVVSSSVNLIKYNELSSLFRCFLIYIFIIEHIYIK